MGVPRTKILPPEEREKKVWIPVQMRREVIERDKNRCVFCNSDRNLGLAYRVPKARGGRTLAFNLAVACKKCRQNKGHQLIEEFILSPYFQFEILKVGDPLKGISMMVKVVRPNGEEVTGEVGKLPDPDTKAFWLRQAGNGTRQLIYVEPGMRIVELAGEEKHQS